MSGDLESSQDIFSNESAEENDDVDDERTDENIIKVLIAGDINLGYEQTIKRETKDGSFRTFEEILQNAKDHEVDAILLAGNLFYESNPPLNVMTKCISLLRKYCLGQRGVKLECLTDPEWIFDHCDHKTANFTDSNLKIKIPVFAICGHRNTPVFDSSGSLDLLAATGLVNYFGKWPNEDKLSIPPILLRKGITNLALYGLNHMNDKKLTSLIKSKKFEIVQDSEITDPFNLLVIHQNRARPGRTEDMFFSEKFIPNMFNFILWGHEPVCSIEPEWLDDKSFAICQPGGCIATSLTRGETIQKKVAVLKIYKSQFAIIPQELKTVRPFVYSRLDLNKYENQITELQNRNTLGILARRSRSAAVEHLVDKYIKNVLLPRARKKETDHPKQPKKPLLRVKIISLREQDRFNLARLVKKYRDIVSNARSMIYFSNPSREYDSETDDEDDYEGLSDIYFENDSHNWNRSVEGGIADFFNLEENRKKLSILSYNNLNQALEDFKNNDKKAFERAVKGDIQKAVNQLMHQDIPLEDIEASFRD